MRLLELTNNKEKCIKTGKEKWYPIRLSGYLESDPAIFLFSS
jgi:hypothetical protein